MFKTKAKSENIDRAYRFLKAVDITPEDDTFHGNIKFLDIEWWYFDAIFDNGYSIHIGVRTYHLRNIGFIQSRIDIYKKGKTEVEAVKTDLISKSKVNSNYPTIKINNKPVIEFDYNHYKNKEKWKYHLYLKIGNNEVDLIFISTTKGWKIETADTCWAVPLPKAKVNGTITLKGKKIKVAGVGYHDHNWSYSPFTAIKNLGWFWGRITADTLNITFAKTMQGIEKSDLILVLNQDSNDNYNSENFYNFRPEDINFIPKNFIYNNHRRIPTEFDLTAINKKSGYSPSIDINVNMRTLNVHHTRLFIINYWRYHVVTNGEINLGSKIEKLDNKTQIIEFISFKSKDVQ